MYSTVTCSNRANKKPEKENSTHHFWLPFSKKNSNNVRKNPSQISGAPNSARGTIEFQASAVDNYKTRIVDNNITLLSKNPSMKMSRAGSIDKNMKSDRR
jgi:hypothetical protein